MPVVAARIACAMVLAALPTGCGHEVTMPDHLAGTAVARMAERELEAENPGLAAGTLTCPDLDLRVGSSVRCVRTTALGNGRIVKVAGTVQVASMASGGRLHVAMDSQAVEFGVAGDQVAADLRRHYRGLFHRTPGAVDCPYLRAKLGARATCRVRIGSTRRTVDVVVTQVDPQEYDVRYTFRPHRAPAPAS
jgi:hypothetical protein